MKKVKIAIIGAGTAGLSARREVAKLTDDYVVIDGGKLGTTCARKGCMPSKVLIQIANDFYRRKIFSEQGIEGADHLKVNLAEAMQFVRKLRDRFVRGIFEDMKNWQDKLINEDVEFIDPKTLKTRSGKIIQADKLIIAVGTSPILPTHWLPYKPGLIDTDEFFELKTLPKKMLVIGLGVIGIELGQALARLGVDVTLVGLGKSIGGLSDPTIQRYVAGKFTSELDISFNGAEIMRIAEGGQLKVCIDKKINHFDKALLAMGRAPNLHSLNLERIGIKTDGKIPDYHPTTYELINFPHIYLVGDVNLSRPLLHEAADQGQIAGFNAVRNKNFCFAKRVPLAITFCDPNIAIIGTHYQKLIDDKTDFVTGSVSFEGQGRSIVKSKEQGLLHLYAEKAKGEILGAELQAPDGEHLAHLLAWAIANQMTVDEVLAMPFYHPSIEEGLRTALRDASKQLSIKTHSLELFRCGDTPIR